VRVAGPFTVESLSPHRVLGINEDDELIDAREKAGGYKSSACAESVAEPHYLPTSLP